MDPFLLSAGIHASGMTYDTSPNPPDGTQDCTRFCYAVLHDIYGEVVEPRISDLHIDSSNRWANIEALLELGLGEVASAPLPGRHHYVQGWNEKTGHSSLFYRAKDATERSVVLQSTPGPGPWFRKRDWASHSQRWAKVRLVVLKEPT